MSMDTFAGAKPRFLDRGKNRRSASTLSIPELQTVESNGLIWKINGECSWRDELKRGSKTRVLTIT